PPRKRPRAHHSPLKRPYSFVGASVKLGSLFCAAGSSSHIYWEISLSRHAISSNIACQVHSTRPREGERNRPTTSLDSYVSAYGHLARQCQRRKARARCPRSVGDDARAPF